jgi:hypothetical protein
VSNILENDVFVKKNSIFLEKYFAAEMGFNYLNINKLYFSNSKKIEMKSVLPILRVSFRENQAFWESPELRSNRGGAAVICPRLFAAGETVCLRKLVRPGVGLASPPRLWVRAL